MIQPDQVFLVVEPVDMRLGVDGLSLKIQLALGRSPCDGTAYAFRNKRSSRLKLLIWDGNGVWLCHRRLHQGSFVWPVIGDQGLGCVAGLRKTRLHLHSYIPALETTTADDQVHDADPLSRHWH